MITNVQGQAVFQVLTNNFSISPSSEGYTLQISADGKEFTNLFAVSPNTTRMVTGVAAGSYYRLLGNNSKVSVNWQKVCVTGGGASGTELTPVADFPMDPADGTVIAYTGSSSASGVYQYDGETWVPVGVDDLSAYWTSAQTKDYVDSAVSVFWTSAQTKDYVDSAVSAISLDKLVPVSELPVSAETGTVMATKPSLGYWSESGLTKIYTITDLEGVNRDQGWINIVNVMGYYPNDPPTGYTPTNYDICYQFNDPNYNGWRLRYFRDKWEGEEWYYASGAWDLNPENGPQGLNTVPMNEEGTKYLNIKWNGPTSQIIFYATDAQFDGNIIPLEMETFSPGTSLGLFQYDGTTWNEVGADISTEEIELPIAAAVNELKGDFEARLNQKYYTKQEVNDIAARKVEAGQVNVQIKDYVDPAIAEVNNTIEDKELPVSAALNELNEAVELIDEVIPAAIVDINDRMVSSSSINTLWKGTQAEYDATTQSGATADPNTFYIIL